MKKAYYNTRYKRGWGHVDEAGCKNTTSAVVVGVLVVVGGGGVGNADADADVNNEHPHKK